MLETYIINSQMCLKMFSLQKRAMSPFKGEILSQSQFKVKSQLQVSWFPKRCKHWLLLCTLCSVCTFDRPKMSTFDWTNSVAGQTVCVTQMDDIRCVCKNSFETSLLFIQSHPVTLAVLKLPASPSQTTVIVPTSAISRLLKGLKHS